MNARGAVHEEELAKIHGESPASDPIVEFGDCAVGSDQEASDADMANQYYDNEKESDDAEEVCSDGGSSDIMGRAVLSDAEESVDNHSFKRLILPMLFRQCLV